MRRKIIPALGQGMEPRRFDLAELEPIAVSKEQLNRVARYYFVAIDCARRRSAMNEATGSVPARIRPIILGTLHRFFAAR